MSKQIRPLRQGDVLLIPAGRKLPGKLTGVDRDAGRVVLAYGEVTGHAHAIADNRAALYSDAATDRIFLEITAGLSGAPAALEHEEHATVTIDPGVYEVRRQREYQPAANRLVAD